MEAIANCSEGPTDLDGRNNNTLFKMWVGDPTFGDKAYVWADHYQNAEEMFFDYLDDNNLCSAFTELGQDELEEAANDLGLPWPNTDDEELEKIQEKAEEGYSMAFGHTTPDNCGMYIEQGTSGGDEIHDDVEIEEVARESMSECWGHTLLVGDTVLYFPEVHPLSHAHLVPGSPTYTRGGLVQDDEGEYGDYGTYKVDLINGDHIDIDADNGEGYTAIYVGKDTAEPIQAAGLRIPYSRLGAAEPRDFRKWMGWPKEAVDSEPPAAPQRVVNPLTRSRFFGGPDKAEKKRQEDFFSQQTRRDDPFKRKGYKGSGFLGVDEDATRPQKLLRLKSWEKK
jgi:hypothetical protein